MATEPMWVVTDVAPYRDGPAGVHGVLAQARTALCQLGRLAGLDPRPLDSVDALTPGALDGAGVLALFTIGETPFSADQRARIEGGWRAGRLRLLGVHSATDACRAWDEYGRLLGARFDGHPWTQPFVVDVVDGAHPATAHLGREWHWHDEVYLFSNLRPDARVLLRLAGGQVDLSAAGAKTPECGFPLSWCVDDGPARSFYSALGHFPGAWEDPAYLRHLLGGLTWLLDGERP